MESLTGNSEKPFNAGTRESPLIEELERKIERLTEDRNRLATILNSMGDTVSIQDTDLRIVWQNQMDRDLCGDLIGRHCYEAYEGRPEQCPHCQAPHVLKDGQPRRYETTARRSDGSMKPVSVTMAALRNGNGEITGFVETSRDITEQKEQEEALKQSEGNFRYVLENSLDVAYRLNLESSSYDYLSPSTAEVFGFSPEELKELGFETLEKRFHPEDREKYKDHFANLIQGTLEPAIESTIQYRWLHKNGKYRWYSDNRTVLRNVEGAPVAIVGSVRDVTAAKEAEEVLRASNERFRQIADNIRELFLVWDVAGKRVLYVSPAYEEIWGVSCESLYADPANLTDLVHDQDKNLVFKTWAEAKNGLIGEIEARIFNPDLGLRWIRACSYPVRDAGGEVYRIIIVAEDVTDKKAAEEAASERAKLYRFIASNTTDMITRKKWGGLYSYVSPSSKSLLGFEPEELLGRKAQEFLHPDDIERTQTEFNLGLEKGGPIRLEHRRRRKDGSYVWVETTYNTIPTQDGAGIEEFVCVTRDISERRQSEQLAKALLDLAVSLSTATSPAGAMTAVLDAAMQIHDVDCAGVYLLDAETSLLRLVDHRNLPGDLADKVDDIPLDSPRGEIVMRGAPYHTCSGEIASEIGAVNVGKHILALSAVPIQHKGSVFGCLNVASFRFDRFSDPTRMAFETLVAQAGEALSRISAEQAVAQERDHLKTVLNSLPVSVYFKDTESRYVTFNAETLRLNGLRNPEDLLGKSPFDLHPPERAQKYYDNEQEIIKTGIPRINHAYALKTNDGQISHRIASKIPLRNTAGETIGLLTVESDVTELKRAEEALKESEANFKLLIQLCPVGLAWIDFKGKYLGANPAYRKMLGRSQEELKGKDYIDTVIPARNREAEWEMFEEIRTKRPRIVPFVTTYVRAGGEEISVHYSADYTRDKSGNPVGLIICAQDVTDREKAFAALAESQRRLDLALTGADMGLWDFDLRTGEQVFNDRWAEMLGYTLDEYHTVYSSWEELVHPRDKIRIAEAFNAHCEGLVPLFETELRLRARGGNWKWVLARGKVVEWDEENAPLRAVGTHLDITERKTIEETLDESEETFRAMFEQAADPILLSDVETGEILEFNSATHETLEYAREEFLKLRIADFEANESAEEVLQHLARIKSQGADFFETRWRAKSGKIKDIVCRTKVIEISGKFYSLAICRDITERKAAEEKFRSSEERFSKAFHSGPMPALILQINTGALIEANQAFVETSGFPREEILGRTPVELGLLSSEKWDAILGQIKSDGRIQNRHDLLRRKDGELRHCVFSIEIIETGGEKCLLCLGEDVTEQRKTEEDLKHSEERFSRAFENLPILAAITTKDGVILEANRAWLQTTGYTREETVGNVAGNSGLRLVDGPRLVEVARIVEETGRAVNVPISLKTKSGELRHCYLSVECIEVAGEQCHLCFAEDVTERIEGQIELRKSEERFSKAFQNTPALASISRLSDGQMLAINRALQERTGYTPEEAIGKTSIELKAIAPDEREDLARILKRDGRVRNFPITVRAKNGEKFRCLLTGEIVEIHGESCLLAQFAEKPENGDR